MRLSKANAFRAVALAFASVTAFSTTPSSLYGIYERQEGFSLTTITLAYAVYAVGTVVSLIAVGHISDWYGRRTVLVPAIALAAVASSVLILSASLPALILARILTGLALGATVATATAYLADLDVGQAGRPTPRASAVTTAANVGGLATGPLVAGLIARYGGHPLIAPYVATLAALLLGVVAVLASPESHPAIRPRPRYRPQRLALPAHDRAPFVAATGGVFLSFAAYGLFAGLAGAVLTRLLHHPSPALAGATIFVTYGSGAATQIFTAGRAAPRLLSIGIAALVAGLALVAAAAWWSPPSLAAFLLGGVLVGAGGGAVFRSSIAIVLASATADGRASALATFFAAGFCGLSVPVIGLGVALQHLSTRTTLLGFTVVVSAAILAAAPVLLRSSPPFAVPAE